ncbi:MAG: 4-alpha-glucanotransferase [Clostridia bacterium]|nr:4-alpha-glucanotransferase [Clostridia bacterium]
MNIRRSSGVLLPIFSLPSKYGIGTLGRAAYDFVYFLSEAGQSWWQMLPAGPAGAGNSPYHSLSSFEGNPLFIDLDLLIADGKLDKSEVEAIDWGTNPSRVDYDKVKAGREKLFAKFTKEEIQGFFNKQWADLREYAHSKGVGLMGDVPIYVPLDSSDVEENKKFFQLDEEGRPTAVAGCPPDYFSKDGQLWNNPLYDWNKMKEDGYGFWIRRVGKAAEMYDMIRIDHFRGLASYWSVPAGAKTAAEGHWEPGPGLDFVNVLTSWFHETKFIAEDLGTMTPDVIELLNRSGLPGMKVLEFAFDPTGSSAYLPHKIEENSICYVGTHDNAPVMQWLEEADEEELAFAKAYLGLNDEEGYNWGFIRGGMQTKSTLFVTQMQDYLGLGKESRINTPGTVGNENWSWRMSKDALTPELCQKMLDYTRTFGRI